MFPLMRRSTLRRNLSGPLSSLRSAFAALAISLILTGCGIKESMDDAKGVINDFYAGIEKKEFESVMSFYGETFFSKMPKDKWLATMTNLNTRLGNYREHSFGGVKFRKSLKGTTVTMRYSVTYAKAKATETFTLMTDPETSRLKIVGHRINSPAFLEALESAASSATNTVAKPPVGTEPANTNQSSGKN